MPSNKELFTHAQLDALAASMRPARLTQNDRASLKSRIMARVDAAPPTDTVTIRGADVDWVQASTLVERKILLMDFDRNEQTYLVRMKPGAAAPAHSHQGQEIVWVLEGEIQMGDHVFRQGDLHVAAPGSHHAEFKTTTGALVLIRGDIPPGTAKP